MSVVAASSFDLVPTGLPFGSIRWGAHLCHFYRTPNDLEEIVAAFFAAGVANRERCLWVSAGARAFAGLPDGVAIVPDSVDVLECERAALRDGFTGLRVCSDAMCRGVMYGRRITALCSYALDLCERHEIMDVLRLFKSALMRKNGVWEHVGSTTAAALFDHPGPVEIVEEAEHLVLLQAITSAFSSAVSYDNLGAVVTAELAPAVGATRVGLVIDGELIALRGITTPDDIAGLGHAVDALDAQWTAHPGDALAWIGGTLVAVLPLVVANARIGTLLLGFERPSITPAQRALVDDGVRQLACAVERARSYERAVQEKQRAEHACAARDRFLSVLGHELRNPLSPILGATQLMRVRAPDDLVKERTAIERGVEQLTRLVDDLQDIAQIARGDVMLACEPLELGELVARALETTRSRVDARVKFAVDVPPRGLVVDVDPIRILQVLVKLFVDAATKDVEIAARETGDMIELVVRDQGAGFEPADIPQLFELFGGGDPASRGLGAGLAIARAIAALHGGTLDAASEGAGTGATLTLRLPRWRTERTTDEIEIPSVPGGRKILVVDDNEDAAWLLAEALRLLGHDVQVSYDGLSALDVARRWGPEIALLDIGLPGMNGYDLCRELATLPVQPYCIAVSGYGQPKDRAMAKEAGFEAHFVKPVDLRDVQAAIEALSVSN